MARHALARQEHAFDGGGITELGAPAPSIWDPAHYRICPVMGPTGIVDTYTFSIARNADRSYRKQARGLCPVEFANGLVTLSLYGRISGYVLYQDVCNGSARSKVGTETKSVAELHPGVDGAKFWDAWQGYCKMQLAGSPIRLSEQVKNEEGTVLCDVFTARFLHPESKRRREIYAAGGAHAIGAAHALDKLFGTSDAIDKPASPREDLLAETIRSTFGAPNPGGTYHPPAIDRLPEAPAVVGTAPSSQPAEDVLAAGSTADNERGPTRPDRKSR